MALGACKAMLFIITPTHHGLMYTVDSLKGSIVLLLVSKAALGMAAQTQSGKGLRTLGNTVIFFWAI